MPHNYFDIETTGLNPEVDQIITIQYQKIALDNGTPEEELKVLKSWSPGWDEKKIISEILPFLMSQNPFQFVPVGNNLNFEFRFLATKINKYFGMDLDAGYFHSRPYIDLKPLMVLLNGGRFKGYHLILNKPNNGSNVPIWYENKEYDKILNYIDAEAVAFTRFYENVNNLMFNENLKKIIFNTKRRMDDFV